MSSVTLSISLTPALGPTLSLLPLQPSALSMA